MTESLDVFLYRAMLRIRRFEETVLEHFPKGVFYGTTHTYLGQEANAVGVLSHLRPGDIVFSNHRCHGHFLVYGGDMRALFAELMGKPTGVCAGRGGSQHLHWRDFYSNGIQGGIVPVATGMALAEKRKGSGAVVVCFLGDGTLGEGVVYESLNLAALGDAPVLYVVEDNRIAQTTSVEHALAGEMAARFRAFGLPVTELDTSDVREIHAAAGAVLDAVRRTQTPHVLILHTCRFGPHSKGDDTRPVDEVARLRQTRDPIRIQAARLSEADREAIHRTVEAEVQAAFAQATDDPPSTPVAPTWTLAEPPPLPSPLPPAPTVLDSLNAALHQAMQSDERVVVLGEDILDPYGGAFRVTRGLSTAFPDRVWSTPISEAGFVGVAAGMALRGLRPVVEVMFGDFVTLIADQVVNHVAKFRFMYHEGVRVPLVIRTPMGGRRGYGPTHSQSLEKLFLGVPGLKVVAPCALGSAGELLWRAILDDEPVFFVENKLLYLVRTPPADLTEFEVRATEDAYPTYSLRVQGAPLPQVTLVAYGHMAELVRAAALRLAYAHEIFVEVVVPTQLSPVVAAPILESARRTGRLVTAEEGTLTLGWGAEVIARATEELGGGLSTARVAARDLPIPAAGPLEDAVLPQVGDVVAAVRRCLGEGG